MKNNALILIIACSTLLSCETREAWFSDKNEPPVLTLSVASDSAKKSLKISQASVSTRLKIVDENNRLSTLVIQKVSGESAQPSSAMDTEVGEKAVNFQIKSVGVSVFDFIGTDILGKTGNTRYTITVFENLAPVAKLSVEADKKGDGNDAFSFVFDASLSKDQDVRFGGGIQSYQYTLDNSYTFNSTVARTPYSFLSKGRHTVKLVAVDNEGALSESVTQEININ